MQVPEVAGIGCGVVDGMCLIDAVHGTPVAYTNVFLLHLLTTLKYTTTIQPFVLKHIIFCDTIRLYVHACCVGTCSRQSIVALSVAAAFMLPVSSTALQSEETGRLVCGVACR